MRAGRGLLPVHKVVPDASRVHAYSDPPHCVQPGLGFKNLAGLNFRADRNEVGDRHGDAERSTKDKTNRLERYPKNLVLFGGRPCVVWPLRSVDHAPDDDRADSNYSKYHHFRWAQDQRAGA